MRRLRLELSTEGVSRSYGVMDWMMAAVGHGLFVDLRALERSGVHARASWPRSRRASHIFQLRELIVEIGKGEFIALELLLQLGGLLCVERGLRLFNQREHVAHAEDARGHAAGVERLDLIKLFAGADEFDGLAGHGLDGKRRAASCVAVELGEHDAR